METIIFNYFLKVSISITLFYGLYMLLFRNDTLIRSKRIYLLFSIVFSIIFPLTEIQLLDNKAEIVLLTLPQINISLADSTAINTESGTSWVNQASSIVYWIFIVGFLTSVIRLFSQIISIYKIKMRNEQVYVDAIKVINLQEGLAPFSFFKWIFIPLSQYSDQELQIILLHEKTHSDEYHSIDVLISELFCSLFWWNPIALLIKKEIKLNLEYLADKKTLKKGIDSKEYQYLLLQITNPNTSIQIVNKFNVSLLKKRIMMINKTKSSKKNLLKYALILPLVGFVLTLNSTPLSRTENKEVSPEQIISGDTYKSSDDDIIYEKVEIMPEFPGGIQALMTFLGTNIKYPEKEAKEKIEGRSIVRFVVTKTGEIDDIEVIKSSNRAFDQEAIRVVKAMPNWTPGTEKGKSVDVYFSLPVMFKLKKDK